MKTKELGFFWPSFTDLMVSLFFIMMVLYILTYLKLSNERRVTEEQLKKIVEIQNAIKALPSEYFDYSEEHKKHILKVKVNFRYGSADIKDLSIEARNQVLEAGRAIERILITTLRTKYSLSVSH